MFLAKIFALRSIGIQLVPSPHYLLTTTSECMKVAKKYQTRDDKSSPIRARFFVHI